VLIFCIVLICAFIFLTFDRYVLVDDKVTFGTCFTCIESAKFPNLIFPTLFVAVALQLTALTNVWLFADCREMRALYQGCNG